jgi:fructose-bisphosphate aldolase, class II
MELLALCL